MFPIIQKIQRQPEHVRKNIALILALVIMVPIFLLWFSTLSLRGPSLEAVAVVIEEEVDEVTFSVLREAGEELRSLFGIIK